MAATEITRELLAAKCGQPDVGVIYRLPFNGLGIRAMKNVSFCPALIDIDLSGNSIARMEGLDLLDSLRRLNLSGNALMKLEGVGGCLALEELLLEGNKITNPNDLKCLSACPQLSRLHLQSLDQSMSNPVCGEGKRYRDAARGACKALKILDGQRLAYLGTLYDDPDSAGGGGGGGGGADDGKLRAEDFTLGGPSDWAKEAGADADEFGAGPAKCSSNGRPTKEFMVAVTECKSLDNQAATKLQTAKLNTSTSRSGR